MTSESPPLTAALICEGLTHEERERFTEFCVLETCESTNSALLAVDEPVGTYFLAAREQTAGRGRREREWVSSPGSSLAFSVSRLLRVDARLLGSISLVVGAAVVSALRELGCDVSLKWPNDVVRVGARGELLKAGGILVEARSMSSGEHYVVIGIGLNLRDDVARDALISQNVAALNHADGNEVVAGILSALLRALDEFELHGFAGVRERWFAVDALSDATVDVIEHDRTWVAKANGIDEFGRLCVIAADGSLHHVTSAEVSVRVR